MATYIQTDFGDLDAVDRYEAEEELLAFLEREGMRFRTLHLHARLKRLAGALGQKPLLCCTLQLDTGRTKFYASEEAFGVDAAVKSAILALRYQVDRFVEMRAEAREKADGRRAYAEA